MKDARMGGEANEAEVVLAALERTLARGSARFDFRHRMEMPPKLWAQMTERTPRRGGTLPRRLARGAASLLWRLGIRASRWAFERAARGQRGVSFDQAGVIDFREHRCLYATAQGGHVLVVGDRSWSGAPGSTVSRLPEKPAGAMQPLWSLALARCTSEASEGPDEVLGGLACRRFSATADVTRASELVPHEMAPPPGVSRLSELRRVPFDVWISEDGHLRRIRRTYETGPVTTLELELTELGVELPSDWSRLPR